MNKHRIYLKKCQVMMKSLILKIIFVNYMPIIQIYWTSTSQQKRFSKILIMSLGDRVPIALFESVFPLDRLPGIDRALAATSSVTEALARVGVPDYTRLSTRLTAIRADATQALHLQMREGDPLMRSTAVNVDLGGVPVEFGRTWFAGDRVTLTLGPEP